MIRAYLYAGAAAALIGILAWAAWAIYDAGHDAGKAECQAERATNVDSAQEAIDLRDQRSAENNAWMPNYLRAEIPAIQVKSDDVVEVVRIEYRDRVLAPAADACSRPERVQTELDAARDRANGTGTALQARPHAAPSAGALRARRV